MDAEKGIIAHRSSQKKYKLTTKGKETQAKYNCSEAKRKESARYRGKNKWRRGIYYLVERAQKLGILLGMPCEVCDKPNTFAHHDDYEKPLEVRWLCNFHHCEYHKRDRG